MYLDHADCQGLLWTSSRKLKQHAAWQVFILDSLATYKPRDGKDAESIVERVTPRLQHANCAVVLSAVKVGITHPDYHVI